MHVNEVKKKKKRKKKTKNDSEIPRGFFLGLPKTRNPESGINYK